MTGSPSQPAEVAEQVDSAARNAFQQGLKPEFPGEALRNGGEGAGPGASPRVRDRDLREFWSRRSGPAVLVPPCAVTLVMNVR